MSKHYFSCSGRHWFRYDKTCAETFYVDMVFLHPVRYVGHEVRFGASRAQNINAIFFMLGCARCASHKKHIREHYVELVFLDLV
jgi:hypothetical protein